MSQKLSILESWFVEKMGKASQSAKIREVGEIILHKGLASDIDTAIKVVFSQLRIHPDKGDQHFLELDDFYRIFLKACLKASF